MSTPECTKCREMGFARDFYYKAALTSLDDDTFSKYKESVIRCEKKIELMITLLNEGGR